MSTPLLAVELYHYASVFINCTALLTGGVVVVVIEYKEIRILDIRITK